MTDIAQSLETRIEAISATVQDYMLLIYILERDQEPVVGSHLAELLGVTPPTVTNTLKRMLRDGWLTMDERGTHLTEDGLNAAIVVMRRHMLMEWMMEKTLPWSQLHAEAHNLEHAISASAEKALMEQMNNPQNCPHGNPLPGYEQQVAGWVPLTRVEAGKVAVIRRIHELAEENTELLTYLESKNLVPGKQVTIYEVLPFNETVCVEVDGQQVTLGNAAAKYVFVETA
jgi:DtxR family Mn-dependent transcriptional regulator